MKDYAAEAIARMRSPRDMHIICVDVTNKCDLHCSNCTRLLANQPEFWDMTPENFRTALRSLKGYQGVIAMIGGNPCMHKQFPELCQVFVEEIPVKRQRGLWTNNSFKYNDLIRETFGFFNLNPHNDKRGVATLTALRDSIPGLDFFKGHSHHAPLLTAMRDLYTDEQEMWDAIATCDINREWSATVVENQGEPHVYFCEVAASFDLARGENHGVKATEGWWTKTISDFADQVRHFCPGCGVPARLKGNLDVEEVDTYTCSNADIVEISQSKKRRKTRLLSNPSEARRLSSHVTNYNACYVGRDDAVDVALITVAAKDGSYHCLPYQPDLSTQDAIDKAPQVGPLPAFILNLITKQDNVLFVGPGFTAITALLASKANSMLMMEPDRTAAQAQTLVCQLNKLTNVAVERVAAYDQNALSEFGTAADPYHGVVNLSEIGNIALDLKIESVNCARIDDRYGPQQITVMIVNISGYGDLAAVKGAEKKLDDVRLLFLEVDPAKLSAEPEQIQEMGDLLQRHFANCYAPHLGVRDSGSFAAVLQHAAGQSQSGFLILSKDALI